MNEQLDPSDIGLRPVPGGFHWQPPFPLEVLSHDLRFTTEPLITGWNRALERAPAIETTTFPIGVAAPRAIQVPIRRPSIRVRSFQFPEPTETPTPGLTGQGTASRQILSLRGGPTQNITRIRPPADVIKLEDRLSYLLQPPLEALLTDRAGHAIRALPLPVRWGGVPLPAACGDPGR